MAKTKFDYIAFIDELRSNEEQLALFSEIAIACNPTKAEGRLLTIMGYLCQHFLDQQRIICHHFIDRGILKSHHIEPEKVRVELRKLKNKYQERQVKKPKRKRGRT